jgi:predicted MFS family arabinose efflux permease
MNTENLSLLLAAIGATILTTSWIGSRSGDAARDVRPMHFAGACLLAAAAAVYQVGTG